MLFDTHAHLDSRQFDKDREQLLQTLPQAGVTLVMNPGCDLESSRFADRLSREYDYIYAAVGNHPSDCDELSPAVLEEYRVLCRQNPKIRAIGEIGLDYHYDGNPHDVQQQAFRQQLQLARELQLPVIIHDREAHGDCLQILQEFPDVCGVFHCYSGSEEMAKYLTQRGWYIGFTGVITFKNARKAVEVAQSVPLDRLVIETDCPYLTPEPFRSKRNDPGYLHLTAECLAQIRGLSLEELARITMENGKRLYAIE